MIHVRKITPMVVGHSFSTPGVILVVALVCAAVKKKYAYDHLAWLFYSENFRVKPMHYVSWLMGHEGPGSILSFLIKR